MTLAAFAVCAGLAVPSQAMAVDRFVDDTGVDAGACTSAASPCDTIGYAQAQGFGDRILLGPGFYPETVQIGVGELARIASVFAGTGTGPAIVDNSVLGGSLATDPAITVNGGTVRNLTVRSDRRAMLIGGGSVIGNTFDQSDTPASPTASFSRPRVEAVGAPLIQGNTFVDPSVDVGANESAIQLQGPTTAQIRNNSFVGLNQALRFEGGANGGTPLVEGNTFTGLVTGSSTATGIFIRNMTPTVVSNTMLNPVASTSFGISFTPNVSPTGATTRNNRFLGLSTGIVATDMTADIDGNGNGLVMRGDVIAKSTATGLFLNDSGTPGDANVFAQNVTITDTAAGVNNEEINNTNATLTLDSSIVGDLGMTTAGSPTCVITFSRGPTTGAGCANFTTTASPLFANAASNNYHLLSGSPMIDAGNPASAAGQTDPDGDPRALDGRCPEGGPAIRDIGADEFNCVPNTRITARPRAVIRTRKKSVKVRVTAASTDAGSTFRCKLDKGAFRVCPASRTYRVKLGAHTIRVFAVDPQGQADPTPAVVKFRVKKRS